MLYSSDPRFRVQMESGPRRAGAGLSDPGRLGVRLSHSVALARRLPARARGPWAQAQSESRAAAAAAARVCQCQRLS